MTSSSLLDQLLPHHQPVYFPEVTWILWLGGDEIFKSLLINGLSFNICRTHQRLSPIRIHSQYILLNYYTIF